MQKLAALLHNVTVQLASLLDVLYAIEFLFKYNNSHSNLTIPNKDQYVYLEHILR